MTIEAEEGREELGESVNLIKRVSLEVPALLIGSKKMSRVLTVLATSATVATVILVGILVIKKRFY